MEILQLRYFYESAKLESFAKTAEKFMVPATSVSASVKRLENELGCTLFKRCSNRIMLNENGKKLRQSLCVVFDELDKAVDSLASACSDTRTIKMLVRAMRSEITNLIIKYKTRHPHISFKTVFDFSATDFENYDIIIDEKSDKYGEYEQTELFYTQIRLRATANNPLCRRKLTLKQLADQPFVSIGENSSLHKILIDACKNAGFAPDIVFLSNDLQCLAKCIEAGVGIGPVRQLPGSHMPDTMRYLNVTDFNKEQIICSYFKKQSAYGNVEHFLRFLKENVN